MDKLTQAEIKGKLVIDYGVIHCPNIFAPTSIFSSLSKGINCLIIINTWLFLFIFSRT